MDVVERFQQNQLVNIIILELPAGARPGERPEWVRDRRATALVFGEQTWDLSWTHPCGSPQSNSSHLLRIVMYHVFFQWQTSSWAVLICGMSPNTLDRQPFHFSRCQVVGGPTCWILTIQCSLWKPVFARENHYFSRVAKAGLRVTWCR